MHQQMLFCATAKASLGVCVILCAGKGCLNLMCFCTWSCTSSDGLSQVQTCRTLFVRTRSATAVQCSQDGCQRNRYSFSSHAGASSGTCCVRRGL